MVVVVVVEVVWEDALAFVIQPLSRLFKKKRERKKRRKAPRFLFAEVLNALHHSHTTTTTAQLASLASVFFFFSFPTPPVGVVGHQDGVGQQRNPVAIEEQQQRQRKVRSVLGQHKLRW